MVDQLASDKWFRRGWTLQELLAPRKVKFYWKDWRKVTGAEYDIIRVGDDNIHLMEHDTRTKMANTGIYWSTDLMNWSVAQPRLTARQAGISEGLDNPIMNILAKAAGEYS